MNSRGRVLVGISAWADPSLIASYAFYPADVKNPVVRLRYYSSQFPIAEIDSSFHFFPTRRNIDLWLNNTPDGFRFHVKAFSLFTQHPTPFQAIPKTIREKLEPQSGNVYQAKLDKGTVDTIWEAFADDVGNIETAGKLGLVFFQFPPWFHFKEENLAYLTECRRRMPGFYIGIEFRTGDWLSEANRGRTLETLREHRLTLVCVDEPQGLRTSVPPLAEATTGIGYVRFHGRNAELWERKGASPEEKFAYLYQPEELQEWAPRIRTLAEQVSEVHVILKNKHLDYPVRNAMQLKRLLEME